MTNYKKTQILPVLSTYDFLFSNQLKQDNLIQQKLELNNLKNFYVMNKNQKF
ncbi:hypothetical protein TTHERM_00559820 (macronuclear) [Tetrahymena thermophila SB210]|uniref:Uncharacterized protein n=1 Tax=Tetrahymena thermophila (strain SB210) TaxID=312017 RepID=I7M756_TETTS|nr:hypothetical protein TTHERM_00559820 [Tetrahymena thermophila SB210]EAR89891.1 hypothetical protein TTHERM_00559820 [Tetrahymena thermophila SB210]|eukprot:XP_001010136.1 hypothetical protein TTHERM_00559820 [Tetrahymena thermophila SB210]